MPGSTQMCGPDDRICGADDGFSRRRRRSKDYERLTEASEAFIYAAMIRLMLKRVAQALTGCISILLQYQRRSFKQLGQSPREPLVSRFTSG